MRERWLRGDTCQQLDASLRTGRAEADSIPVLKPVLGADGFAVDVGAGAGRRIGEQDATLLVPGDARVLSVDVPRLQAKMAIRSGSEGFLDARGVEVEGLAVPRTSDHDEEGVSRLLARGISHTASSRGGPVEQDRRECEGLKHRAQGLSTDRHRRGRPRR